ncbi:unnamed protein product [Boreogadus saida]
MVENAGKLKISLRPPGEVPHPFGRPNPDGTDAAAAARDAAAAARDAAAAARDVAATARDAAAAARDAAAAARDAAAAARDAAAAARDAAAAARDAAAAARDAAAAAGEKAAARGRYGTAPPADADVGTGRPCMLATCWAQGTSGSPTIPARVMNRDTQALLDTGQCGYPPSPRPGGREGRGTDGGTARFSVGLGTRPWSPGAGEMCLPSRREVAAAAAARDAAAAAARDAAAAAARDAAAAAVRDAAAAAAAGDTRSLVDLRLGQRVEECGIPPRKPRPGRARGTVKDGVYHPHPPAGDGEQPFRLPNQGDWGTPGRKPGRLVKRSRWTDSMARTGARKREVLVPARKPRGPRRP